MRGADKRHCMHLLSPGQVSAMTMHGKYHMKHHGSNIAAAA